MAEWRAVKAIYVLEQRGERRTASTGLARRPGAGPVVVDRTGGPPPFPETLNYIRSVLEQIKAPFDPKLFASPIR